MNITYNILLKFLNKKRQIPQDSLAKSLGYSKSSISRLISGKMKTMNNDITKKVFYEKLLKGYEGSSDFIQELFHYLQKNDAVNSRLDDLYLNFCMESDKNNSNGRNDTMRAFISEIMDEAEDSRTEIHIDENLQSPIISFAPLNLHATEGFVGRKKTITTISSVLEKYGLVILCGIGGVGKSQTALHYAEQKKNENIYHQVQMVYFDTDL